MKRLANLQLIVETIKHTNFGLHIKYLVQTRFPQIQVYENYWSTQRV